MSESVVLSSSLTVSSENMAAFISEPGISTSSKDTTSMLDHVEHMTKDKDDDGNKKEIDAKQQNTIEIASEKSTDTDSREEAVLMDTTSTIDNAVIPTSPIPSNKNTGHSSLHKESLKGYNHSPSNVKFGTVHVREHRMTMGSNPEVGYGVPIELAWEKQQSFLYDTVDEFEQSKGTDTEGNPKDNGQKVDETETDDPTMSASAPKQKSGPRAVRRIPASEREEIAHLYHSRDSIRRVTQEIHSIQESRNDSRNDKAAQSVILQLHRTPHTTVASATTTLDDVLTAHLEKTSKKIKEKGNEELDKKKKKKKKWWSICE